MELAQVSDVIEAIWDGPGSDLAWVLLQLLKGVAIIGLAVIVARVVKRRVAVSLRRPAIDPNVAVLVSNLAVAAIYLVAFSLVLALFGANWSGVLAVIGAGTIVIGLSLQDLLKSYVAGVYILLERPFAVGDRIRVKDVEGVVDGVELRTTILRTDNGEQITVPNATVFLEIITNRSTSKLGRTTVVLSKVDLPLAEITPAVTAALSRLDGAPGQPPKIDLVTSTAEGTTVTVTAFHPAGTDITAAMLAELRGRFPEADLTVEQG